MPIFKKKKKWARGVTSIPHVRDIPFTSVTAPSKGHPVFIASGAPGQPSYVIKLNGPLGTALKTEAGGYEYRGYKDASYFSRRSGIEQVQQYVDSFEFGSLAYRACLQVFPDYRILDAFERAALFAKLKRANRDGSLFDDGFLEQQQESDSMMKGFWTIIDCVDGLHNLKSINENPKPGDTKILQAIRRNETTAEEMGRILALDIFFGNFDRAVYGHNGAPENWATGNEGNFFIVERHEGANVLFLGIDFFFGMGPFSNLYRPFNDPDGAWPGRYLKRANLVGARRGLGNILDSMNEIMGSERGMRPLFGPAHKKCCADGFQDGAKRLKKFLDSVKDKPSGVKQRKASIGW